MEKKNLNYYEILKKCIYVFFCLSFFFYTAFKVSIWNNVVIVYYLEKLYDLSDILRRNILIPLLFITETISIIYKLKNKELNYVYVLKFGLFLILYLLMKRYAYYWRFEELIVFIYFAKYLEFSKIIYLYMIPTICSLIFGVWGCIEGYLPIDGAGRGLTLGFSHSNGAALAYFMLYLSIAYCLRNKKDIATIVSIPFIYLIGFVFKSRTPFYSMIIFIVLLWLEPLYKKALLVKQAKKVINVLYIIFPVIMILLAIYLGIKISQGLLTIDGNASVRFKEFVLAYREKGLALYYRDFLDASRHYYFDNGYAQLLFKHGLVPFCSIYLIWILNGYRVAKDANYFLIIMNIVLFIYMMMEFIMLNDLIMVMMTYYTSKQILSTQKGEN